MNQLASRQASVLVVDDEPGIAGALDTYLRQEGYHTLVAPSAEVALQLVLREKPDVALVDLRLPGMDGLTLLKRMRLLSAGMEIVFITAYGGIDSAIQATQEGACAYLPKPLDLDEVGRVIKRSLARSSVAVGPAGAIGEAAWELWLGGSSPSVRRLREQLAECAGRPGRTLLVGEVGAGREAAARALHACRGDSDGPFRRVHCTAADADFDGALEEIRAGVPGFWFLDELGDLDPARLQRVMCGPSATEPQVAAAVQVLPLEPLDHAAAHVAEEARRAGWSVVQVPPLRARREDLEAMASRLLGRANHELALDIKGFDRVALERLLAYRWPGNLRELENTIRAAALAARHRVVLAESLPPAIRFARGERAPECGGAP